MSPPPRRRTAAPRIWKLLRFVTLCYLVLLLIMMSLESRMIFPAPRYPSGDWHAASVGAEDHWFASEDGTQLHGWLFKHPDPKAFILFCHGNGEHVAYVGMEMAEYRDRLNATVFVFDYRGYGRSDGKPNEAGVLLDGHAAQRYFSDQCGIAADEVILIGRSIGGAIAIDMAAELGAKALVIDRTFTSLPDVAAKQFPWLPIRLLMRTRFDSKARIQSYAGPLLQLHGTADELVPFENGKQLFQSAPMSDKKWVEITGGGHNSPHTPTYWREVEQFVQRVSLR